MGLLWIKLEALGQATDQHLAQAAKRKLGLLFWCLCVTGISIYSGRRRREFSEVGTR